MLTGLKMTAAVGLPTAAGEESLTSRAYRARELSPPKLFEQGFRRVVEEAALKLVSDLDERNIGEPRRGVFADILRPGQPIKGLTDRSRSCQCLNTRRASTGDGAGGEHASCHEACAMSIPGGF
jgi:hypothetical protein